MSSILTFIIPVRHHDNADNWEITIKNLQQTIRSIQNQSDPLWKCIIVVNRNSKVPSLPDKCEYAYVDFPPNIFHDRDKCSIEEFRSAVRKDKGKRVLEGLKYDSYSTSEFYMIVDDDDYIHRDITKIISKHNVESGYFIKHGFVWNEKSNFVYKHNDFSNYCGTSLIIKKSLVNINEDPSIGYIMDTYGSHVKIKSQFESNGFPLTEFPFTGAIYRIGHSDNHSKTKSLLREFVIRKKNFTNPMELLRHLSAFRYLSLKKKRAFGMLGK